MTLGTVAGEWQHDLGAGNDTLMLVNGTNIASVSNTETVTGGSGNDSITLGAAASNASIDLGAGNDALTLGAFANTATISQYRDDHRWRRRRCRDPRKRTRQARRSTSAEGPIGFVSPTPPTPAP